MTRRVLVIPKEEILQQFKKNIRKDVKVVPPKILTDELYQVLEGKIEGLKLEQHLEGILWSHSERDERNKVCESGDFDDGAIAKESSGPFALSFASKDAKQAEHYHEHHVEIYLSEHAFGADYRFVGNPNPEPPIHLADGGAIVFGPGIVHKMRLTGLTIVIEVPSLPKDKIDV